MLRIAQVFIVMFVVLGCRTPGNSVTLPIPSKDEIYSQMSFTKAEKIYRSKAAASNRLEYSLMAQSVEATLRLRGSGATFGRIKDPEQVSIDYVPDLDVAGYDTLILEKKGGRILLTMEMAIVHDYIDGVIDSVSDKMTIELRFRSGGWRPLMNGGDVELEPIDTKEESLLGASLAWLARHRMEKEKARYELKHSTMTTVQHIAKNFIKRGKSRLTGNKNQMELVGANNVVEFGASQIVRP